MICSCAFIGDPVLGAAFDLVGVTPFPAETPEEAVKKCDDCLIENRSLETGFGLIMIEASLWNRFDRETLERFVDNVLPAIVPVDIDLSGQATEGKVLK